MGSRKSPTSLLVGGGVGFEDKTVEFLGLSFLTLSFQRKFQTKWNLAPQPWKNCATPHETSKSKNQDFLNHHCPRYANSFLIEFALEFPHSFFQYTPKKFQVFNPPPVWIFFWNTSSCYATKVVIWLFGWNSPVHWAIPEKIQTGGGYGGYTFLKNPWNF